MINKIKDEAERRMTENCELSKKAECFSHRAVEDNDILALVDSLRQEQPMPDSTQLIEWWHEDKEMLKEKDFRDEPWRLAYNAFMCGFGRGIAVKKQEQPELPGIEEPGIPGKDFIPVEWVDACEMYGKWKIVKQEQPEVDLDEVIENYILENFGERWDGCVPVGCFELDQMAEHFFELGRNARKED